jgi:class 3 adenylate cyclase
MGTAAASLAGLSRAQRIKTLLRYLGPCVGGHPGSVERKAFWTFAAVVPLANFCGAIDVFLFLWYVMPLPHIANEAYVEKVNLIAFAITMVLTFGVCGFVSNTISMPIARWLDSGEPADEAMVRRVLRNPGYQALISAVAWLAGAATFGVLNAILASATYGAIAGLAIALGGVTTCGMLYLLAEKALHPITVRALGSSAPRRPALPGVDARILVVFAVTTAGPLLMMGGVGALVLWDSAVSTDRLALTMLVLAAVALTSGLVGMKLVSRSLALPLRSMRAALARVERGDLDADVRVDDGSEVGVLQAGFNSMVAGLREREELRDLFGRHVGEHVANSALERGPRLGGELLQAAVLFVDVIGSTSLAAERAPDDVVALLNRYFGIVVEVAQKHHGWVNKFEGDGALCVFGAPTGLDDPAGCALSAAREMDARLRAELGELPAAIGVSAGTVVAGNVGAAERFEYTVIGDPVNEAARLVQLAKEAPGRVLASAATLARAVEREQAEWKAEGEAQLRGRPRPTKLVVPRSEQRAAA